MAIDADVNPYRSPSSGPPIRESHSSLGGKRIYTVWFVVFVLNAAAPLFLGWGATVNGGRIGMLAATVMFFALGCCLCAYAPEIAKALVVGGVAVGLTQVMPLLQVIAWLFAVWLLVALRLEKPPWNAMLMSLSNEPSGFLATIVFGGVLMAACFMVGLPVRALFMKLTRAQA